MVEKKGCGKNIGAWTCGSYVEGQVFLCLNCRNKKDSEIAVLTGFSKGDKKT